MKTSQSFYIPIALILSIFWLSFTSQLLAETKFAGLESSQDDSILQIGEISSVFTASKYDQKVTEGPSRISIS